MHQDYETLFYNKTTKSYNPKEIIEAWASIVETVQDGYNDVEPELEHDLLIRNKIENLIEDQELKQFQDHEMFKNQIFELDDKLKNLIFINPKIKRRPDTKWLDFIILKKGRPEICERNKGIV